MAFVGSLSGSGGASNTINVTGSMIIANPGTGGLFPSFPGSDTVFFVSGAIDGKTAGSRTVSVFGGDVVASGSITVGTGSVTITSNEIRFLGGVAKITSSSAGLTFFDSNNTGGKSLTELAAGDGGGGGVFTEASGIAAFTTSSIAIGIAAAASTMGSDVFLFVSGSTDGTKNALFGGDVVTSGSLQVIGNEISGSTGGNILLGASGAVTVAGDLTVNGNIVADTDEAKSIFAAVTSNTITIGAGGSTVAADTLSVGGGYGSTGATISSAGNIQANGNLTVDGISTLTGNVTVTGDLTVNGTVVAIDTTNLRVKDAIVLIGSGTTSTSFQSVIAFSSGSKTGPNSLTFGASGGDDTLAAGIQDVNNGEATSISFASLAKVKAAAFKVATDLAQIKAGGSTDSIVVSGSQVILQAPTVAGVSFQSPAGATYASVDQADLGETMFKGVGTTWFSGSSVNIASNTGDVAIAKGTNSRLFLSTDGSTAGTIAGRTGSGTPSALTLTGSTVTIGAHSAAIGITFAGANTSIANLSAASSTTPSFVASQTNATFKVGTSGGGTDKLIVSGSAVEVNHTSTLKLLTDGAEYLRFSTGPGLGTLIGGQVSGRNVSLAAAGAGKMILSGSTTTLSGSSIDFVNDNTKVAFFGTSGNSSGLIPNATNTFDLGTPDFRWRNMYTGDLHLKNERGDWTVIEEEDFLTLTNNKSGKRYKFVLEEI